MSNDLPDLRASHADRDRVVDALRVAGGDGRLSAEELDTRLESALSARTLGELAELTADLPIPVSASSSSESFYTRKSSSSGRDVAPGALNSTSAAAWRGAAGGARTAIAPPGAARVR